MYRLACKSPEIEAACRLPSCVYPGICPNLNTDHSALISPLPEGARGAGRQEGAGRLGRALRPGRHLARVRPRAGHPPRGRLPEDRARAHGRGAALEDAEAGHRQLREVQGACSTSYSQEAGKKQYLIPYFIAAHPGTTDRGHAAAGAVAEEERLPRRPGAGLPALADGHRHRDVPHRQEPAAQAAPDGAARRCPSPRASRCAACTRPSCATTIPENWPLLREALRRMGRADLIGNGPHQLIPLRQPPGSEPVPRGAGRSFRTQHARSETAPAGSRGDRSRPG